MPKSKRAKLTTLSKTPVRHTKASKLALVNEVRAQIDQHDHVWLFSVGDMRNEGLKDLRAQWRGSGRIFFGKGKVMAKALGDTVETEYQDGMHKLAQQLRGPVGLFITSHPISDTKEWFSIWHRNEYARMGALATDDIVLPQGSLLTPHSEPPSGDPFPHSMEPQLRSLGLSTTLARGIPSLNNPHQLCRRGEALTTEKCQILKLLGIQMADFRIHLGSRWTKGVGYVRGSDLTGKALQSGGSMDED